MGELVSARWLDLRDSLFALARKGGEEDSFDKRFLGETAVSAHLEQSGLIPLFSQIFFFPLRGTNQHKIAFYPRNGAKLKSPPDFNSNSFL